MVPDLIVKSHLPGYNIPEISVGEYYREAIEKVIENEPNKIAFVSKNFLFINFCIIFIIYRLILKVVHN